MARKAAARSTRSVRRISPAPCANVANHGTSRPVTTRNGWIALTEVESSERLYLAHEVGEVDAKRRVRVPEPARHLSPHPHPRRDASRPLPLRGRGVRLSPPP